MKNRFAQEDAAAAQEDLDRQTAWLEDGKLTRDALVARLAELTNADGTVDASNIDEHNEVNQELQALIQEIEGLETAVINF